jgi:predicted  nucleic acid-binding Zn-ribbon protein
MSGHHYIRDRISNAVLLADPKAVSDFKKRKEIAEEIRILKDDINTLKAELQQLKTLLGNTNTGN